MDEANTGDRLLRLIKDLLFLKVAGLATLVVIAVIIAVIVKMVE